MPSLRCSLLALAVLAGVMALPGAPPPEETSAQNSTPVQTQSGVSAWRSERPVRAPHAMVVSVHHLASDAGLEVLKEGGNAVDAAVATGFALAVVHPVAGNLGGGGFLLLRTHDGKSTFIDYREKAPLAATETMYQDAKGNVIPDASVIGYRSIATPGSVAGLVYSEKKYGKLGLKRVMAPAIKLARDGIARPFSARRDLLSRG